MSIAWFYAKCCVKKRDQPHVVVLYIFISAVALRRRKVSSDIQLRTSEAAAAEKVRYSTGSNAVWLGQNVAYDTVDYPDEAIYEYPST